TGSGTLSITIGVLFVASFAARVVPEQTVTIASGEGLAEPYPSARRSQSSAVRAPEVGEHDALEGARPCRARIRPAAELDGRQDCAHHWHRAGEVQDWHDELRAVWRWRRQPQRCLDCHRA